jgi:imidazolonepropionase-like amidohydrolase
MKSRQVFSRKISLTITALLLTIVSIAGAQQVKAQIAVSADTVYTMSGPPIKNGIVIIRDGKIAQVGPASSIKIPDKFQIIKAVVVTPGLIDAHSTVGLSGALNQPHDQMQVERSAPIQPELRAMDSYDGREKLIGWLRSHGVTTMHTGHGPGSLISGQTMIVKTVGDEVEEAVMVPASMVAATLGDGALIQGGRPPGTHAKMIAMLRAEFQKAKEYDAKQTAAKEDAKPARDLRLETLALVLKGELPLLVTVNRAHNIVSALRLAKEFNFKLILDGAVEAYTVIDQIKAANVSVIVHPTMQRAAGETENLSMENAATLHKAGIPIALQSGFEGYVPKTRVVLFEAAMAAANGLTFEEALGSITIDAARLLGISKRVGSLETGKDADLTLFDGDPFEHSSHVINVIINGRIVSEEIR